MAADEILSPAAWIRRDGPLQDDLSQSQTEPWDRCAEPGFGSPVTSARTSWTRRGERAGQGFFVKVYVYPDWRARWRGLLRNTWLAPSRARREWEALRWLRSNGFAAPQPWGVAEQRGLLGDLRRAVLVTEAWPAPSLESMLRDGVEPATARQLHAALEAWVMELHCAGFRDRNLDPRNILVRREADGSWQFAKIDSPRFRLLRPCSRPDDRLARADVALLARGMLSVSPRP
jgi:hypothetical protein